ncbi:extracellular solute-binding protein [Paenibacillus sacheonensis]|uniref:Extracellular solute-binding protein n=1 Tax=Paenibacillus sacheonensis TaxID=742054 RepID=A0A7X5BWE4_9BACL|nr:extracellular solute-binding protein [Paenibacillus sacheonensis]MBM7564250.1 putative aldouronate transport system substrate-binding protein [Paenibacillus sacheonensis]NBC67427.1 extracellular solute-binding protein [Paenibacillus sacheonensis]
MHHKTKMLSAVLLVSVMALSACSSKDEEKDNNASASGVNASGQANTDPLGKYDPPIELHVGQATDSTVKFLDGESFDNNPWHKEYEDVLGINLKYDWVADTSDASQYESKLNVTIASGELPDVMYVPKKQFKMLVDGDQIEDLTDAFNTYASPLTKKILMSDPKIVDAMMTDGKLLGIPNVGSLMDQADVVWVRQDWLKKLNLPAPKTIDDIEKIAEAFVKQDPDGNGKADTYGLAANKDSFNFPTAGFADLTSFANAYHAYPRAWVDVNGKLEYGSVQPQMKQALAKLQEMYKEGLIDSEFIVKDGSKVAESVAAGKLGLTYGRYWNAIWPFQDNKNQDKNADWQAYPIVSADDETAKAQVDLPLSGFTVVRKGYAHPEAVIKALNLMFENYDGDRSSHWTPIDQDKKYVDKGVLLMKYPLIYMEPPTMNMDTQVKLLDAFKKNDPSIVNDLNTKRAYDAIMKYRSGDNTGWAFDKMFGENSGQAVYQDYQKNDQLFVNGFYGVPGPVMNERMSTLQKLEDETFTKIIMGSAPLDDFDKFVERWKSIGGDDVTAEVNEWYAAKNK